jgi:molybdenum cofactor cytidylyltransferase
MAVILAAGEGRRMGFSKALLEYEEGETFLQHIASVFAGAGCDVLAVVGYEAARVAAEHRELASVENERWNDGQLSSARVGIARALEEGAPVILVHPVDLPSILVDTVRALLSHSTPHRATVPQHRGRLGHPLVLPRACAEKVLKLERAQTLEAALATIESEVVSVDDPGVDLNFNTPQDYERAFGRPPRIAIHKLGDR